MTVALDLYACKKYTKCMRISWQVVSVDLFTRRILRGLSIVTRMRRSGTESLNKNIALSMGTFFTLTLRSLVGKFFYGHSHLD